jgi:hypothetical protein
MGPKKAFSSLTTLITSENTVLDEPSDIHQYLTNTAQSMFRLHREVPLQPLGTNIRNWTYPEFFNICINTLPPELHHTAPTLWNGYTHHLEQQNNNLPFLDRIENLITHSLNNPRPVEEFIDHVRHIKADTAPGPTGLSYSMIKHWPDLLLTQTYHALLQLWNHHTSPQHWSTRLMVLIPKTGSTLQANSMRPIMLCECLRKLFVNFMIKPIFRQWDSLQLFSDTQQGYRAHRTTAIGILGYLAALHDAQMDVSQIASITWDASKAFDSVTPFMLKLSYQRFGFPEWLSDYLIDIDLGTNGKTFIKSPFFTHKWFSSSHHNIPFFTPERGMGQGDVPSAPLWNAFYQSLTFFI